MERNTGWNYYVCTDNNGTLEIYNIYEWECKIISGFKYINRKTRFVYAICGDDSYRVYIQNESMIEIYDLSYIYQANFLYEF